MKTYKRGQMDFSFTWLLAIIVGAVILFLAIYTSVKLISVGETEQDAKMGKEVGIILSPLETSVEDVRKSVISFPVDTRVTLGCATAGFFGEQEISISQKSFNKWTNTNINTYLENKYIFANQVVEGRTATVLVMPFFFPFKVADLTYLISTNEEYCFSDAPESIKEKLSTLHLENILVENCSKEAIDVCFNKASCEIEVDERQQTVTKNKKTISYSGESLMFGAIFSDNELYNCQVQRLMKKISILAGIYKDKASFISTQGCNTDFNADLSQLISVGNNSGQLVILQSTMEEMKKKNENAICKLW